MSQADDVADVSAATDARQGPAASPGGAWRRLVAYARPADAGRPPAPASEAERMLYGLAQPLSAARLLLRHRDLLSSALVPVFWLAVFCGAVAIFESDGAARAQGGAPGLLRSFYRTFAVLAPVPSIVFAGYYARLSAATHERLGLGPCRPRIQPLLTAASHALRQLVVVAIAVAPLLGVLKVVPALGTVVVSLLGALWALHWIVVESLDGARVLPLSGPAEPEEAAGRPWFVRLLDGLGRAPVVGWAFRRFAGLCNWLSRPWHEEIALCEAHPALLLGYALTTAALLAVPVLNLCFRPVITAAAVGLLGEVRREDGARDRA